jgi:protein SCO1/2
MQALGRVLADEERRRGRPIPVRLVSFSIDPEHDTVERLAEYGAKWGADPARWSLLAGSSDDVQRVVVEGFKVGVTREPGAAGTITHGSWFVLVDKRGKIRGFAPAMGADDVHAVAGAAIQLADEETP